MNEKHSWPELRELYPSSLKEKESGCVPDQGRQGESMGTPHQHMPLNIRPTATDRGGLVHNLQY